MALLSKIFGDPNEKEVKKLRSIVADIRTREANFEHYGEGDFKAKVQEYKNQLSDFTADQRAEVERLEAEMFSDEVVLDQHKKKELKTKHENASEKLHKMLQSQLENMLPDVFALIGAACRNLKGSKHIVRGQELTWEIVPYDVQYVGGIAIHQGKIAEMRTGEGKTFVASLPLILNSLTGRGAHLITVNEYLAQRDAEWMSHLYTFLGLTVGTIVSGMKLPEKRAAYECDITYGTNNEFGFDYLRDNMAVEEAQLVQREQHFAIVDEVDSILIDEARTPLIISAPKGESTDKYFQYAKLVKDLEENVHYNIDEKQKTATLSEEGITRMEQLLGVDNIYTQAGFKEVHHMEQALKAMACYKRDFDYVIMNGEVQIVDEFTGRILHGRRYSQGLHQAIEAKESVEVKQESMTLASITFQNLFRMYDKLSGMTGTAITEAEEFGKIYGLDVIAIPTNKPIARKDKSDAIFMSAKGKFKGVVNKTKEYHEKGQPVLIGTISIEKSEYISELLKREGVPHSVLNAKHHEEEAEIVANAGEKGAVTIATNMAGRGTDIKISDEIKERGGLVIIGTERHESRRIDNQLRGRSGRQGDPGESQFYISMDDDLMRIFGGDRMKSIMATLKVPEDMPIENGIITKQIEAAQRKVENYHYDIRENVVKYDDVMNRHREIIYARRKRILKHTNLRSEVMELLEEYVKRLVITHTSTPNTFEWNRREIAETVHALYHDAEMDMTEDILDGYLSREEMMEKIQDYLITAYDKRESVLPDRAIMRRVERSMYLRAIDGLWMEHLETMNYLRSGVSLRGYGQRDPLVEYKNEAYGQFEELLWRVNWNVVQTLYKVNLEQFIPVEVAKEHVPNPDAPAKVVTNEAEVEDQIYSSDIAMSDVQEKQVQVIRAASGGGTHSIAGEDIVGDDGIRLTRKERKKLEKEKKKEGK